MQRQLINAKIELGHRPRTWRIQSSNGAVPSAAHLPWGFRDTTDGECVRVRNANSPHPCCCSGVRRCRLHADGYVRCCRLYANGFLASSSPFIQLIFHPPNYPCGQPEHIVRLATRFLFPSIQNSVRHLFNLFLNGIFKIKLLLFEKDSTLFVAPAKI